MLVSLFTSRIVLKTLGVEDYGIYNIVGGVIVLFSFINNAMASATQRFLNFAIGTNNKQEVDRVFSMSMTAHISIALLILLLGETIGLWFFHTQLNIPEERMYAAQWVYQFTIITSCVNIIKVPYNASIIAYEKMSFYAYVSILESLLRLLIVYLLVLFSFDKLILYAILTCAVSVLSFVLYKLYCNKTFDTCRYNFFWDSVLYKKLMSFSGWSLFGAAANVGANQGVNILLNIFYGVTVNAAMAIANQVNGVVYNFVSNFQIAFKPQIIKSYAAKDYYNFKELIYRTSKFSYYLLLFVSLPIIICCEQIMDIWLVNTPLYAVQFTQIIIIASLIDSISVPLWTANEATGDIKKYQLYVSIIISLNLPFSYIALKLGLNILYVVSIKILISLGTLMFRIFYLERKIGLNSVRFFKEVLLMCFCVSILSIPLPYMTYQLIGGWKGLIATFLVSIVCTALVIYTIGLKNNEKQFVISLIRKYIKKT